MAKQLDQNADGREIEVAAGESFEIALGENPTTGFQWQTAAGGAPVCRLVKDEFVAPAENRPGQGGHHVWQFRAVKAGQGEIELTNSRAGRTEQTKGRTFTLRVRVTE